MYEVLLVLIISMIPVVLIAAYVYWQIGRLPENRPANFAKQSGKTVVVLAGDSITHGRVGESYASILENRLDEQKFTLINAGINGELAWNLLQRLGEIIDCQPDFVTIMIGTNDAAAATSEKEANGYIKRMKLPQVPDDSWYHESLKEIVTRLQRDTSAHIALLSIPPIGEDLEDKACRISSEYIKLIQEVANSIGVSYLPLHENMLNYLKEHPGEPTYPFERAFLGMIKACFKHYILRKDWNTIGRDSGFILHIDYLHLNTVGATMVADMIEEFMNSYII